MQTQPPTSVRAKSAAKTLGVGESTFWRLAQRPDFPKARRIGTRITIWDLGELLAWRDAQAANKAD